MGWSSLMSAIHLGVSIAISLILSVEGRIFTRFGSPGEDECIPGPSAGFNWRTDPVPVRIATIRFNGLFTIVVRNTLDIWGWAHYKCRPSSFVWSCWLLQCLLVTAFDRNHDVEYVKEWSHIDSGLSWIHMIRLHVRGDTRGAGEDFVEIFRI